MLPEDISAGASVLGVTRCHRRCRGADGHGTAQQSRASQAGRHRGSDAALPAAPAGLRAQMAVSRTQPFSLLSQTLPTWQELAGRAERVPCPRSPPVPEDGEEAATAPGRQPGRAKRRLNKDAGRSWLPAQCCPHKSPSGR